MIIKELKKNQLIELAKIGGLLFYVLVRMLVWILNPMDDKLLPEVLIIFFVSLISGYISISLLFIILKLISQKSFFSKKIIALPILLSSYLSSVLWLTLNVNIGRILSSESLIYDNLFFIKAFSYLFLVIAFVGLFYLISYWLNLKNQKRLTLHATNLANEAQLQMLRYQINPHFLFNALNTIRSMVEEDKAVARNMITELSNFFRYSLSQNGTTDTIENEIKAIKNYLEIQKIRFEDKLVINYDIDEELYQMKIPFFIILPLVENAIKFGLQSSKIPLTIKIYAKANKNLEISVHNTGSLIKNNEANEGTHTGIENTKKRLSLYFPDNYSFKLFEEESWVISQIIIKDYKDHITE